MGAAKPLLNIGYPGRGSAGTYDWRRGGMAKFFGLPVLACQLLRSSTLSLSLAQPDARFAGLLRDSSSDALSTRRILNNQAQVVSTWIWKTSDLTGVGAALSPAFPSTMAFAGNSHNKGRRSGLRRRLQPRGTCHVNKPHSSPCFQMWPGVAKHRSALPTKLAASRLPCLQAPLPQRRL